MNHTKRSPRLNRLTAVLIAAGCIASPLSAQTVIIGDTGVEVITIPGDTLAPFTTLILGNTASGNGTLNWNGGPLTIGNGASDQLIVGNNGRGTVNMTDGTVDILNNNIGTNAFLIGNNAGSVGVFTQSGGAVNGGRSLTIGANGGAGTYNLNTDTVNATTPTLNVGFIALGNNSGQGTFNQQAETTNTAFSLLVGRQGTYNLQGGALNVTANQFGQGSIVGTSGSGATFNQTGGTHATNNLVVGNRSDGSGTYVISGGALAVNGAMYVGLGHNSFSPGLVNGLFQQSGGNVSAGSISIGGHTEIIPDPIDPINIPPTFIQHFGRGRYEISGGTVTSGRTVVGESGQGVVQQSGGIFNAGSLTLGNDGLFSVPNGAGFDLYSSGTYNLLGGVLNTNGTTVSLFGLGTFNHSGTGAHNVTGDLVVGSQPAFTETLSGQMTQGTYNFSGGTLSVSGMTTIGAGNINAPGLPGGLGTFNHSGGTATLAGLILGGPGTNAGGQGTYNLTGTGVLNVTGDTEVGAGGTGVFTQNGAGTTHTVNGTLYLGGNGSNSSGATLLNSGTYNLMAGTLQTGSTQIGRDLIGVLNQTGGTHQTNSIMLGNSGSSGGNSSGTYNLSAGVMTTGDMTVGGFGRGVYNQSGGSATVATNLVVGSGPEQPAGGGNVPFREGIVTLSGGSLTALNTIIGGGNNGFVGEPGAKGTFTQTGGSHSVTGDLIIGQAGSQGGGNGTYNISGLATVFVGGTMRLGDGSALVGGTGTVNQTGGSVAVTSLFLGSGSGAGTYNLSGTGEVSSAITYVGEGGFARFNQSGGTFSTNFLNLGLFTGADSVYTLSGGALNVSDSMNVGGFPASNGVMNQSGGTAAVTYVLTVNGGGSYNLSGGALTAFTTVVGNNGIGTFTQSGGTHTTSTPNIPHPQLGDLVLGLQSSGNGTYNLSGTGVLNVNTTDTRIIVGAVGQGTFNQSGGTATAYGLSVGNNAGGTGHYTLSGGTLTVTGLAGFGRSVVGGSGAGVFDQTGGTHTTTQLALGNNAGSNGTYNLGGTNAVVQVNGDTLVGSSGVGQLNVGTGGSLTSTGSITLGKETGSAGNALISGSGSVTSGNRFTVGGLGAASVAQSGTSTVSTGGFRVAEGASSTATYTLNGGTLNVLDTTGVNGGSRVGLGGTGTFNLQSGTHNTTFMTIGGGNFGQGGGGDGTYNLSGGSLVATGNVVVNVDLASTGKLNVSGGTLVAPLIANNDRVNYSGGSITANVSNNANFNVLGGAARTLTGDFSNNAGGVLNLATASPLTVTGALTHAATASIVAGANITVGQDYNNLGAGSGNTFNRRANVTGAGQILAAGAGAATAQTLSLNSPGTTTSGNTTLNFGNVRAGTANTLLYSIGNSNTGGPDLRGAIQTTANGGNKTDARLTGAGVTASSFGPVIAGSLGNNLGVTFTASTGGALVNQKVAIVNNFENTNSQILNITGNAFNMAVGGATPTPVVLANQRVGGSNSTTLTVTNTAAPGSFSEDLRATFGVNTGAATNNGGSVNALVAGGNNATAMSVGVSTATAGAKSGSVVLNYQTTGTVNGASNGLGVASLNPPQTINVSGNVYQTAFGTLNNTQANPNALNFGTVQVGQSVSGVLSITNSASGAANFVEDLNARFGAATGTGSGLISGTGAINGLLAGATNNSAMTVSVNTSAAGSVLGSIAVNYFTSGTVNGVSNGLGEAAANASGSYGVSGTIQAGANVVDQAKPVINGIANPVSVSVNLGNLRLNSTASQNLTVLNQATGNQQAVLNASIATNGAPVTASGSFNGLAPGATSTGLQVGLNTSTAGNKSGSATVSGVSDITAFGSCAPNCTLNLAPQTVNVTGAVYREATVATTNVTPSITLAARVNGAASSNIAITNNSVDGFTEGLNVTLGATTPAAKFTSSGGITNLAANASSSAIGVALNTSTAGTFSGSQVLTLASNGTITSNSNVALGDVNVALTGKVYTTAVGQVTATTLDFGIVRVGDTVTAKNITVQNTAAVTALNDTLHGKLTGVAGPFTPASTVGGIVAGASGTIAVGLNTGTAGINNQTGTVTLLSQNPDLADVSAGANASVLFKAQINNLANAHFGLFVGVGSLTQAGNVFTLDLGNVVLGSTSGTLKLKLDNSVSGPADVLGGKFTRTEVNDFSLDASWDAVISGLGAGDFSGDLSVGYLAATLGLHQDTVDFDGLGTNASDPVGLAQHRQLIIKANVINAGSTVPEPGTLYLLLLAAAGAVLARRRRGVVQ